MRQLRTPQLWCHVKTLTQNFGLVTPTRMVIRAMSVVSITLMPANSVTNAQCANNAWNTPWQTVRNLACGVGSRLNKETKS